MWRWDKGGRYTGPVKAKNKNCAPVPLKCSPFILFDTPTWLNRNVYFIQVLCIYSSLLQWLFLPCVAQVYTGCPGPADEVTRSAQRARLAVTQWKTGLRRWHHCVCHPTGRAWVRDMTRCCRGRCDFWDRPSSGRGLGGEETLRQRRDSGLRSSTFINPVEWTQS